MNNLRTWGEGVRKTFQSEILIFEQIIFTLPLLTSTQLRTCMKLKSLLLLLSLTLFPLLTRAQDLSVIDGKATYYGNRAHGRRTASGERYDKDALVCAHRTLPFGTLVRVTNLNNQRQVVVRVIDRGPFAVGRVIDLSTAAARHLDMLRAGVVPVHLEVVSNSLSTSSPRALQDALPVSGERP